MARWSSAILRQPDVTREASAGQAKPATRATALGCGRSGQAGPGAGRQPAAGSPHCDSCTAARNSVASAALMRLTRGVMRPEEIAAEITALERLLSELEQQGDIARSGELDQRFAELRQLYRQRPQLLADRLGQLKALRRRRDELLRRRTAELVDRFFDLTQQIRRAEEEKEALRQLLISLAGPSGRADMAGQQAVVWVRPGKARKLPPAGSAARQQLTELLVASGRWADISQLSSGKLTAALQGELFTAEQRQAIEALLPAEARCSVVARPRGQDPAPDDR